MRRKRVVQRTDEWSSLLSRNYGIGPAGSVTILGSGPADRQELQSAVGTSLTGKFRDQVIQWMEIRSFSFLNSESPVTREAFSFMDRATAKQSA